MAAGEEDKIVEQICDVSMILSDSSPSDCDCDGEKSFFFFLCLFN